MFPRIPSSVDPGYLWSQEPFTWDLEGGREAAATLFLMLRSAGHKVSPTLLLSTLLLAHWGGMGQHPDPPPLLVLPILLPDSLGQLRVVLHKEKQNFSYKPFLTSKLESQRKWDTK